MTVLKKFPYFFVTLFVLILCLFCVDIIPLFLSDYPYLFGMTASNFPMYETTTIYLPMLQKASIFDLFRLDYAGSITESHLAGFPYVILAFFHLLRVLCFENITAAYAFLHLFFVAQFCLGYLLSRKIIKHDGFNAAIAVFFFTINMLAPKFILLFAVTLILLWLTRHTGQTLRYALMALCGGTGVILVYLTQRDPVFVSSIYPLRFISPMISGFFFVINVLVITSFFRAVFTGRNTITRTVLSALFLGFSFYVYYHLSALLLLSLAIFSLLTFFLWRKQLLVYLYMGLLGLSLIPLLMGAFYSKNVAVLSDYGLRSSFGTPYLMKAMFSGDLNVFFFLSSLVALFFCVKKLKVQFDSLTYLVMSISLSLGVLTLFYINSIQSLFFVPQVSLAMRFMPVITGLNLSCVFLALEKETALFSKIRQGGTLFLQAYWVAALGLLFTGAVGQMNLIVQVLGPANMEDARAIEQISSIIPKKALFISDDLRLSYLSQATTSWYTLQPTNFISYYSYTALYTQYALLAKTLGWEESRFMQLPKKTAEDGPNGTILRSDSHLYEVPFHADRGRLESDASFEEQWRDAYLKLSFEDTLAYLRQFDTYIYIEKNKRVPAIRSYCDVVLETETHLLLQLRES